MPLGKGWHWCPNCKKKGVKYNGKTIINKIKTFSCIICGEKFTSEEIKNE